MYRTPKMPHIHGKHEHFRGRLFSWFQQENVYKIHKSAIGMRRGQLQHVLSEPPSPARKSSPSWTRGGKIVRSGGQGENDETLLCITWPLQSWIHCNFGYLHKNKSFNVSSWIEDGLSCWERGSHFLWWDFVFALKIKLTWRSEGWACH